MNTWDDFIHLITSPYLIAMFIFIVAVIPFLKYIRRFYPDSQKIAADEADNFTKELQKNKEDKKVYNSANLKIMFFIFGPAFVLFIISLLYSFFVAPQITVKDIGKTLTDVSPIIFIMLGIYSIKTDNIHKFLFKNHYDKVIELNFKQSGNDPLLKYYEKYAAVFGYFWLVFAVVALIVLYLEK